jgi:hypothetical protein
MQFVVCSPEGAKAQLQRHELEGTPALLAEVSSFFLMDNLKQATSKAIVFWVAPTQNTARDADRQGKKKHPRATPTRQGPRRCEVEVEEHERRWEVECEKSFRKDWP